MIYKDRNFKATFKLNFNLSFLPILHYSAQCYKTNLSSSGYADIIHFFLKILFIVYVQIQYYTKKLDRHSLKYSNSNKICAASGEFPLVKLQGNFPQSIFNYLMNIFATISITKHKNWSQFSLESSLPGPKPSTSKTKDLDND